MKERRCLKIAYTQSLYICELVTSWSVQYDAQKKEYSFIYIKTYTVVSNILNNKV